jgi:hypothetical protein
VSADRSIIDALTLVAYIGVTILAWKEPVLAGVLGTALTLRR